MSMIRNITPRLAERGKIKIGRKGALRTSAAGREFQPPQKLDHFVVTTLDRGDDGNFLPDQHAVSLYGEKPTSLPIRLLFDDPAKNFSSRYACYVGDKIWCTGDGVDATRQMSNGPTRIECPCERIRPDYQATKAAPACKFNGALSVMLEGMPGVGGVFGFRTTSYNSVVNIMSALAQIKLVTGGPIAGIPLNLVLHAKKVASPLDGKTQTIYVVTIEYAGTMDELRDIGLQRLRQQIDHRIEIRQLEDTAARLLLPSPDQGVLDGDDEAEIAAEFYPPERVDPETGEITSAAPMSRLDALEDSLSNPSDAPSDGAPGPSQTGATPAGSSASPPKPAGAPLSDAPGDDASSSSGMAASAGDGVPHQPAEVRPYSTYTRDREGARQYLADLRRAVERHMDRRSGAVNAFSLREIMVEHRPSLDKLAIAKDGTIAGNASSLIRDVEMAINPPKDTRSAG